MPQAIAAFSTVVTGASAYGGAKPSATSLQAQLQRYQQQLSDCVNCASAKTPQGKADIESISSRISRVQESIAAIDNVAPARAAGANDGAASASAPATPSNDGVLGSRLDVYA